MGITYIPPRNNKAKNIKIDDVDNHFISPDIEGALKELAENGGSGSNIDDNSTATNKIWSASKVNAQFNTIAKKTYIENGKLYLLQEDGTKIDTGTTLPTGGVDSKEIELQKSDTHIQWRYKGDKEWVNLVSIEDLKVKGDTGVTPNIQIGTVETLASGSNATASIGGTTENPLLNLGIPRGLECASNGNTGGELKLLHSHTFEQNAIKFSLDSKTIPDLEKCSYIEVYIGKGTCLTDITQGYIHLKINNVIVGGFNNFKIHNKAYFFNLNGFWLPQISYSTLGYDGAEYRNTCETRLSTEVHPSKLALGKCTKLELDSYKDAFFPGMIITVHGYVV